MKRLILTAILVLAFAAACQSETPTPTNTAQAPSTDAPIVGPIPSATPTALPTATPTETAVPAATPTESPAPAATPTPAANEVWVSAPNGLNLRTDAKITAPFSVTLSTGQHLITIGAAVGPDSGGIVWQQVRTDDGKVGWAASSVQGVSTLTTTKPGTLPTPAATTTTTTTVAATGEVWVNSTNGLNLRAQGKATANLIVTLLNGAHLTTLGAPVGPDSGGITWQEVRTDAGQTGWVATVIQGSQTLTTTKPGGVAPTTTVTATATTPATTTTTITSTPAALTGDVWVNAADGLNLRAAANVTATVIAVLTNGQHLTATGSQAGPDSSGLLWQPVRTDTGQTGWVAAPSLTNTKPTGSTATPVPISTGAGTAADLFKRINDLRAKNGLAAYILNTALSVAAQTHSQFMADNHDITHTGAGGTTAAQRITAAGYGSGQPTESIYGGASLDAAWSFWINDPSHLANLLNKTNTVIGIGIVTDGSITYFTIDFGVPNA